MADYLDAYLPLLEIEAETIQGLTQDLPVLTLEATLEVRSGTVIGYLPGLVAVASGSPGEVGETDSNLSPLRISAAGLSGRVGGGTAALALFTISASGWPVSVGSRAAQQEIRAHRR